MNGDFAANSLTVENAEIVNDFSINVAQYIKVTGDRLSINSNGSIATKCLEVPNGLLDVQNCGEMIIDSYIVAKDMNVLAGGAAISMQEQSLVDITGTLFMPNKKTGFIFAGNESSKVKAGTFKAQAQLNNNLNPPVRTIDDLPGLFNGNVGLKFSSVMDNDGNPVAFGKDVTFTNGGTTILEGDEDIYIPADNDGCRPSDGDKGKDDDEPEPVIVIGGTDARTHPISATCVDLTGKQAFVSWHKRGTGTGSGSNHEHDGIPYWGCIEVIELTPADTLAVPPNWPPDQLAPRNGRQRRERRHHRQDHVRPDPQLRQRDQQLGRRHARARTAPARRRQPKSTRYIGQQRRNT